jgi:two-component system response regulator AtoC
MRKRILILDDDKNVAKMLGFILNQSGYDVITFTNASQAIEHLRSCACDVALITHSMPRLNALEILSQISQLLPKMPVVILAERGWEASKAMELGIYDFIVKPVDKDELLLTVRNAIQFQEAKSETQQLRKPSDKSEAEHHHR